MVLPGRVITIHQVVNRSKALGIFLCNRYAEFATIDSSAMGHPETIHQKDNG
jgi:hypothetical protein